MKRHPWHSWQTDEDISDKRKDWLRVDEEKALLQFLLISLLIAVTLLGALLFT